MENLTSADVFKLHTIVDAASRGAKVRWLADDDITVREGVARHIVVGDGNWGFPGRERDVRDCCLRITSWGFEHAVPVRRLMKLVSEGGFAVDS